MNPVVNIIIGAVLLVGAVWYVYVSASAQQALITVIKGIVPAFVALVGVFIIWLELDELKVRRELKAERPRRR